MIISGIQKTSLIDYPRKICTVIFTRGCNFLCGFCHNPELVLPLKFRAKIPQYKIFEHLRKRKGKIEAVVITGGEPTIYPDLPKFITKINKLGYLVKLDTNGTNPRMLDVLIKKNLLDYIAMDIKNSPEKYTNTTNRKISINKIKQSVEIIKNSHLQYEFRTTVVPTLHKKSDFIKIGKWLRGAEKYYLQKFRANITLDPNFQKIKPYTEDELQKFKQILQKAIQKVIIR